MMLSFNAPKEFRLSFSPFNLPARCTCTRFILTYENTVINCNQKDNEQLMAISYSQISRLGSQEIWKRDFVYVDDLAILSSAYARFVIGQEGGPGGGGARRGGGLYLDLSGTTPLTSIEMRKTMLMCTQKLTRRLLRASNIHSLPINTVIRTLRVSWVLSLKVRKNVGSQYLAVEPPYNEGPRDHKNVFAITSFRYNGVVFRLLLW